MGRRGGYRGIFGEVITDLEFDDHKSVKKCIFRTLEQAGANICSMGYQNSNFKIGLSLFGCAEKCTDQNTHCAMHFIPKGKMRLANPFRQIRSLQIIHGITQDEIVLSYIWGDFI